MLVIERRQKDGRWARAEPLVPNPYLEWIEETEPDLHILHSEYIHDHWSFGPRDHWIRNIRWKPCHPFPADASIETIQFLTAWTDKEGRAMLLLRDLEETDWFAAWHGAWTKDQEETARYVLNIRQAVLERLRPLGGPDDVRLIYGWNV